MTDEVALVEALVNRFDYDEVFGRCWIASGSRPPSNIRWPCTARAVRRVATSTSATRCDASS